MSHLYMFLLHAHQNYTQYNSMHIYILALLLLLLLLLFLLLIVIIILNILILLIIIIVIILIIIYICIYIYATFKTTLHETHLEHGKSLSSKPDPAIQRSCGLHLQEQLPQVLPAGRVHAAGGFVQENHRDVAQ